MSKKTILAQRKTNPQRIQIKSSNKPPIPESAEDSDGDKIMIIKIMKNPNAKINPLFPVTLVIEIFSFSIDEILCIRQ